MVHEICSEISHSMGKLVQGIGKLDDDGGTTSVPAADNVARPSSSRSRERRDAGGNDPHTLPSDEESYQSGSDTDDGQEDESEESDGAEGDSDSDDDDGDGNMHGETNSGGDNAQDQEDEEEETRREEAEVDVGDLETEDEKEDEDGEEEDDEEEDVNKHEEDKEGDDGSDGGGGNGGSGDQTTGRGHSGGTNEDRAKDGSHEPAENDSESKEGASMQYWIKRKQNSQEIESPEPFSLLDLVKLDVRKEGTPPDIPMLEVAYVSDGLSVCWEMNRIFKELIDSLEFKKTFEFRLEDICPRKTQIELMQQVCDLSHMATAAGPMHQVAVAAAKGRPSKPPKKQRKVTFIDQPTVVTCDVLDQLGAEYMSRNEARGQSIQMPGTRQVGITQKATTVENQAPTFEIQATMTSSKTTPGFDHSSKPSMPREDPVAHSRKSGPYARKLSVDAKESYVKQLQASTSAD